jgi:hypothetical protein
VKSDFDKEMAGGFPAKLEETQDTHDGTSDDWAALTPQMATGSRPDRVMSSEKARFAETLADVRVGRRVVETTGLGGLLVGAPLAGYGLYALVNGSGHAMGGAEIGVLIALFGGAAAGVGYEIYRHRQRSVLVIEGGDVGVYNAGTLAGAVNVKDFLTMKGTEVSPHRLLLMLAALCVLFIAYGLSQAGGWGARLVGVAPGVYLALLTLSFARSGLRCTYFHLSGRRRKALFLDAELAAAGAK